MIALGGVAFSAQRFSGWNYPQFGSLVKVLSDGTSTGNEVLQSGALPRMQATIAGQLFDEDDVAALHAYNASKASITFSDTEIGLSDDTRSVNILDFSVTRSTHAWLWEFSVTIVEAA